MGSFTFNHLNTVVVQGVPNDPLPDFVVPLPDTLSPFTIAWDGPDLTVGETFTLTGAGGFQIPGAVYTYLGVGPAGEVFFDITVNGITTELMLSDNPFTFGQIAPDFTAVPFICFLAGTRIATPMGEVAVETLAIGDPVLTADGRSVPVRWLGRQTFFTKFGMPEGRRPVNIAAGALGKDLPVRDLRVTADHALLIDGVLVQAGALVNGTSIRRLTPAELGGRLIVYHIETENHDIVLAEGAPAETFIDNVTRKCFDNYAEYEARYGTVPVGIMDLPHPRAMSSRQVPPAIRARIAAAAAVLVPALDEVA